MSKFMGEREKNKMYIKYTVNTINRKKKRNIFRCVT